MKDIILDKTLRATDLSSTDATACAGRAGIAVDGSLRKLIWKRNLKRIFIFMTMGLRVVGYKVDEIELTKCANTPGTHQSAVTTPLSIMH